MIRVLAAVLVLAVTVYAVTDLLRTPPERLPMRIPRGLWLILIVLLMPFGGIAWIMISAVTKAEGGMAMPEGDVPDNPLGHVFRQKKEKPATPAPPLAPDDDPEFLFKLERDIRRQRAQQSKRDAQQGSTPDDAPSTQPGTEADGRDDHEGPDGRDAHPAES